MLLDYYKSLGVWIVFDILIILLLIMVTFMFFKRKNSMRMFIMLFMYAVVVYVIRIITILNDNKILIFTNQLIVYCNIFIIVALGVVYQADLKSIFSRVGRLLNAESSLRSYASNDEDLMHATAEIVKATQVMAKNNIGALIIIVPSSFPQHILDTGTLINAYLSSLLLESIFESKSPLHDGAVIISGNCIVAAGCFLPLTQEVNLSKDLGTRHRAAIGISEETDVLSIVVSEETGIISTSQNGVLKRYNTPEKLTNAINNTYGISSKTID